MLERIESDSSNYCPKSVLITGITGNLGAYTAVQLLRRNCDVFAIVRSSKNDIERCRRRVLRNLRVFETNADDLASLEKRLHLLCADISNKDQMDRVKLPVEVADSWHFASSLKYMPKDREEILRANVDGLKNVLSLHRRVSHDDSRFFYISTAYVGGQEYEVLPEHELPETPDAPVNNSYEESKRLAEKVVFDSIRDGSLFGAIMRPSIVIAPTHSGNIVNFNGFYLVAEAWYSLFRALQKSCKSSILRLEADEGSPLNFIPLDMAVGTMLSIAARQFPNSKVFHIVNDQATTLGDAFRVLERAVGGFLEISLCQSSEFVSHPKTRIEKLLSYGLTYTSPYMRKPISFEQNAVKQLLSWQPRMQVCPDHLLNCTIEFYRYRGWNLGLSD